MIARLVALCFCTCSQHIHPPRPRDLVPSRLFGNTDPSTQSHHNKYNKNHQVQHSNKQMARENRILFLQDQLVLSGREEKELTGLNRNFREQYDPSIFPAAHARFKRLHNEAFAALCQGRNVFYLEGPDAGTTTVLQKKGYKLDHCYIANRHASTCATLSTQHGLVNVVHCDAVTALKGDFHNVPLGGFYFDACGGYVPQIVEMMTAATSLRNSDSSSSSSSFCLGYSLMGGSNRDMIHKELQVTQALVQMTKATHTLLHVLDDPVQFGLDPNIAKVDGNTFTTWFRLEAKS